MGLTSQPTKTDGSIGRVKSNDEPVDNLDTQVPAGEWEKIKDYIIDLADEVGNHVGTAGSLNARVDTIEGGAYLKTDGTVPMAADLDMGGFAITNVGNVDGRDVASDGTKLDGIEAGAEVNAVDSVFGRVGAVVAQSGDYAASLISNDSAVAGSTVKAALDNLDLQDVYDHDPAVTLVDGTPIALTHDSPTADSISITDTAGGQDIGLRPTGVFYGGPAAADFVITGEVPTTVGADGRAGVWTGAPGADGDGVTAAGDGGRIQIIAGAQGSPGGGGAGDGGDIDIRSGSLPSSIAGDLFFGGTAVGSEGSLQPGGANIHIWTGSPGVAVTDIADEGSIFVGAAHDVYITAGTNMLTPPTDAFVRTEATGEIQLSSTTAGIVRIEDADLVFGTTDTEKIVRNADAFELYTGGTLALTARELLDASGDVGLLASATVDHSGGTGTEYYDGARVDVDASGTIGDGTDDPDGIGNTLQRWRSDLGDGNGMVTRAAIEPDGSLQLTGKSSGPNVSSIADADTGFSVDTGRLRVFQDATQRFVFFPGGAVQLQAVGRGTAAVPPFDVASDAGLYAPAAARAGISAGGAAVAEFSESGVADDLTSILFLDDGAGGLTAKRLRVLPDGQAPQAGDRAVVIDT